MGLWVVQGQNVELGHTRSSQSYNNNYMESKKSTCTLLKNLTHVSLNHLHSPLSDLGDGSWDVHHLFFLYLLQNVVNHNKCTCTTHTSTAQMTGVHVNIQSMYVCFLVGHSPAVYYHWSPGGVVLSFHSPVEG